MSHRIILCKRHQELRNPTAKYLCIDDMDFVAIDDDEFQPRVIVLRNEYWGNPMEVEEQAQEAIEIDWRNINVEEVIMIAGELVCPEEIIKIIPEIKEEKVKSYGYNEGYQHPLLPCGCSADPNKPRYVIAPGFHLGLKTEGDPNAGGAEQSPRSRFMKRLTQSQLQSLTEDDFKTASFSLRCKDDKLHFTIEVSISTAVRVLMGPMRAGPARARKPTRGVASM